MLKILQLFHYDFLQLTCTLKNKGFILSSIRQKILVLFLQYLLYGLNILYSAKSESNSMLCLGSIGISLTHTQKMQMEKSSILDGVKGKWRFPYTPLIN